MSEDKTLEKLLEEGKKLKEKLEKGLEPSPEELGKAIKTLWKAGGMSLEEFQQKFGDICDWLLRNEFVTIEENVKLTHKAKGEIIRKISFLKDFEFAEITVDKFESIGYTYKFGENTFFELVYLKPFGTFVFIDWRNKKVFELYELIQKGKKKFVKKIPTYVEEITKTLQNFTIIDSFDLKIDYPTLFEKIVDYVKSQVYLLNEEDYLLETAFIILSWMPEILDIAPYLRFYAPKGSGKTTNLEAISRLAFRSLLSVNPTFASIPRLAHYHGTFLAIDEARIKGEDIDSEDNVWDLLRARSRRGTAYVKATADPYGVMALDVFGLTVISGKRPIPEDVADRCFRVEMQKKVGFKPRKITKREVELLLLELSKLRVWSVLDGKIEVLKEAIEQTKEGLISAGFDSRFADIIAPLIFLTPKNYHEKLLPYVKERQIWRFEEERTTEEANVFQAVFELLKEIVGNLDLRTFSKDVEISVQDVVKKYAQLSDLDYEVMSERDKKSLSIRIGIILKNLGFKSRKKETGHFLVVSYKVLKELANRYLVNDYEVRDITSLPSISDFISSPDMADKSDMLASKISTSHISDLDINEHKLPPNFNINVSSQKNGEGISFDTNMSDMSDLSAINTNQLTSTDRGESTLFASSDKSDKLSQKESTPLSSNFAPTSLETQKYEEEGPSIFEVNMSHLSLLSQASEGQTGTNQSTSTEKDELTLYSKIERDIIELIKSSPFGRLMYDFEIEGFLSQRGYNVEDVSKVLKGLIKSGILILTPNGTLDLNFSKLGGS
uniref:DUF3631 domain-containing protein n=1 Tax=Fervidobacterium pennivorans TaxID=93466 RepID=A0A7V4KEQ4_FERPE